MILPSRNAKVKKLIMLSSYAPSLITFRGDLIKSLIIDGYQVLCLSSSVDSERPFKVLKQWGAETNVIPLLRTGTNPVQDLKTLSSLWKIFQSFKPDLVLSYTVKPVLYGSVISSFFPGISHISMITGMPSIIPRLSKLSLARVLLQNIFQVNKYIMFQNHDDEAAFIFWKYVSKSKIIRTNGSGVNISQYKYKKFIPGGTTKYLLIARLLYDKGIIEYLRAAQLISAKYENVQFSIIGWFDESNPNGIDRDEFSKYINEDNIVFLGRKEDVRESIEAHSVYVLPSYHEGMPRTVLEAMSIGRPIVTTDVPGCRDTVVIGKNGYLVPAKDVERLAEAMEKFIKDPDLIPLMGAESRRLVEDKFDVRAVNKLILESL